MYRKNILSKNINFDVMFSYRHWVHAEVCRMFLTKLKEILQIKEKKKLCGLKILLYNYSFYLLRSKSYQNK